MATIGMRFNSRDYFEDFLKNLRNKFPEDFPKFSFEGYSSYRKGIVWVKPRYLHYLKGHHFLLSVVKPDSIYFTADNFMDALVSKISLKNTYIFPLEIYNYFKRGKTPAEQSVVRLIEKLIPLSRECSEKELVQIYEAISDNNDMKERFRELFPSLFKDPLLTSLVNLRECKHIVRNMYDGGEMPLLEIRNSGNYKNHAFYLRDNYKFSFVTDSEGKEVLICRKK